MVNILYCDRRYFCKIRSFCPPRLLFALVTIKHLESGRWVRFFSNWDSRITVFTPAVLLMHSCTGRWALLRIGSIHLPGRSSMLWTLPADWTATTITSQQTSTRTHYRVVPVLLLLLLPLCDTPTCATLESKKIALYLLVEEGEKTWEEAEGFCTSPTVYWAFYRKTWKRLNRSKPLRFDT